MNHELTLWLHPEERELLNRDDTELLNELKQLALKRKSEVEIQHVEPRFIDDWAWNKASYPLVLMKKGLIKCQTK